MDDYEVLNEDSVSDVVRYIKMTVERVSNKEISFESALVEELVRHAEEIKHTYLIMHQDNTEVERNLADSTMDALFQLKTLLETKLNEKNGAVTKLDVIKVESAYHQVYIALASWGEYMEKKNAESSLDTCLRCGKKKP